MLAMATLPFKEYLFGRFIEWEKQQPNRRSSFSAFARWLSNNSYQFIIKQQVVSDWIKGRYKPNDDYYLLVLEEKLGEEIYEILQAKKPNPYFIYTNRHWDKVPAKAQKQIAEIISKYSSEPMPNGIKAKSPKS